MNDPKKARKIRKFVIYRYQLLAKIDPTQPQLVYSTPEKSYSSIEELRKSKNAIFASLIQKIEFKWSYGEITHDVVYSENDTILIKMAVDRPTPLRTPDFKTSMHDDWPWIFIFIDNNPERQYITVEVNREAWSSHNGLINMLQTNLNQYLNNYFLLVEIKPVIEKKAFWEFVDKHKGKIEVVEFDMISPNMSNISSKVKWPLQEIRDQYNATRQKVRLENNAGTSIDIKRDEMITSMADYSSQGCGTTKFKVKGLTGYKSLSDDKMKIEVEGLEFESSDNQAVLSLINTLSNFLRSL